MKCYIIDDEAIAREGLKEFIERTPDLEFAGESSNPIEAIKRIKECKAELLFLDIQMPQLTGLEFMEHFRPNIPVIFSTAFSEYALDSYNFDVVDYLLKPISYERFLRSIEKVYRTSERMSPGLIKTMAEYIFVKSNGALIKVVLNDILYIKSVQNYVMIVCNDQKVMVHRTLKSFEAQLPQAFFIKVQKSYLVNLHRVEQFDGHLLYFGKYNVPVSRDLVSKLKSILLS